MDEQRPYRNRSSYGDGSLTRINHFPMHIGDFLSGVSHMDGMEIGAYTMLIVSHYQSGAEGLPDDDRRLAKFTHLTLKQWAKVKEIVLEKFTLKDGFWIHSRVIDELQKIKSLSSSQRAKALKRHTPDDATAVPESCQPIANSQEPIAREESTPLRPPKGQRGEGLKNFMEREYPDNPEECPQEWGESAMTAAKEFRSNTKIDFRKLINWHFEKFRDHWYTSTKANSRKTDWRRAWLNWWKTEFEKLAKQEERDEFYAKKRN